MSLPSQVLNSLCIKQPSLKEWVQTVHLGAEGGLCVSSKLVLLPVIGQLNSSTSISSPPPPPQEMQARPIVIFKLWIEDGWQK